MKLGTMIHAWIGKPLRASTAREARRLLLETVREQVTAHRLDYVETTEDLRALYPDVFDAGLYRDLATLSQELGFSWTVHLPFVGINLAAAHEPIRRASVEATLESANSATPLQPDLFVLHALSDGADRDELVPMPGSDWPLRRSWDRVATSMQALLGQLPRERVCVENMPLLSPEHTSRVASEFGTAQCLDIGHLLLWGDDLDHFVATDGARVKLLHLHDVARRDSRLADHQALGTGLTPVRELLAFARAGNRHVTLEVPGWANFQRSMAFLAPLR